MATIDDLPYQAADVKEMRRNDLLYVQRQDKRLKAKLDGRLLLPDLRGGDVGKRLKVGSNGDPVWADATSGVTPVKIKENRAGLAVDTSHAFTGSKFQDYAGFYLEYNGPYNRNLNTAYTQIAMYSGQVGAKNMAGRYRFPVPVQGYLTLFTLDQSTFIVSWNTESGYSWPDPMVIYALWGLKRAI